MTIPEPDITCLITGPDRVNTYIVSCPDSREGVIIDPGDDAAAIIRAVADARIRPGMILNTHGHHDHVLGNPALSRYFGIPACLHRADRDFFLAHPGKGGGAGPKAVYEAADTFGDGRQFFDGRLSFRVIHTPGHTPGSVCLQVADCLFTGDTLFVGDAGRTDLPGGSLDRLISSIRDRILPLPGRTRIFPGHDYGDRPVSTLEREIRTNIYITDFITDTD